MSVTTIANWGANFVLTVWFRTVLNAISAKGVLLLFASLTVAALVYFVKRVPETKGRPLQGGSAAARQRASIGCSQPGSGGKPWSWRKTESSA